MLIQIDSGYFCAAVWTVEDKVHVAAPIIKYMKGWTRKQVLNYSASKGWKTIEMED